MFFRLEKNLDLSFGAITRIAHLHKNRGIPHNMPRTWDRYALVLVESGTGELRQSEQSWRVDPGTAFVVQPGLPHSYQPDGDSWSETYVIFIGPVFDLWRNQGRFDPLQPITIAEPVSHWKERIQSLVKDSADITPHTLTTEVLYLLQILSDLWMRRGHPEPWLQSSIQALRAQPGKQIDYQAVAQSVHLSYEHFRKKFKVATGVSPHNYRSRFLMEQVARELISTDINLAQLAERYAFTDEFHLAKRFKQITGITPGRYRKTQREFPAKHS